MVIDVTEQSENSAETSVEAAETPAEPPRPKRTPEDDALSQSLIQDLLAAEAERAEEEARLAEAQRIAEEARRAEEERLAEETRKAEEAARKAEEARLEEEARLAEEARCAEEARIAEEARLEAERAKTEAEAESSADADAVEHAPSPSPTSVAPRRIELQQTAETAPKKFEWDMPADHQMSRKGRRIWQVAVYGALISVPAAVFALSPFGPRDTVGHHVSAMGCQFAELFDMQNAEVGAPGYHASLDDDADGIACEEKKGTRISMGGGASRFVRP